MDFKGKFEEDWLINEGEDIFLVNLSFFLRSPLSIEHTDFDSLYLKNYFEFFKCLKMFDSSNKTPQNKNNL